VSFAFATGIRGELLVKRMIQQIQNTPVGKYKNVFMLEILVTHRHILKKLYFIQISAKLENISRFDIKL
jgi:hypothetical protein